MSDAVAVEHATLDMDRKVVVCVCRRIIALETPRKRFEPVINRATKTQRLRPWDGLLDDNVTFVDLRKERLS